jgi:hypothetical protein
MTRNFSRALKTVLLLVMAALSAMLHAQSAPPASVSASPTMQEQLEAQYPLGKFTTQGGCNVTNPETGLVIQKPGIGAMPARAYTPVCSTHYKEGKINGPGFWCKHYLDTTHQELVLLESGDKVFVTRFEVNTNKGEVKASIAYCAQSTPYKADLVFQFPKKFLETASVTQVEDQIAEVFSGDSNNQQAQNAPPQRDSPAPADQPASVEPGQSLEQVVTTLGEPDTKAKGAGNKMVYVWNARKLKVTFIDGKVADVD